MKMSHYPPTALDLPRRLRSDQRPMLRTVIDRARSCLLLSGLVLIALVVSAERAARAFDLDDVAERAAELAKAPFRDDQNRVPDWMLIGEMSYDQWRDIRFRPDQALWRDKDLPFQVQFFHPGLYYDRTIRVNTVDDTGVHRVPFSAERFDYGQNDFAKRIPSDIGYAGLRIHYALKDPNYL